MGVTNLVNLPALPGLADAADPTVGQGLRTAENVRFRRLGAAEKRYGNSAVTAPSVGSNPSDHIPNAIFELDGARHVAYGCSLSREDTAGTGWTPGGLPILGDARNTPIYRSEDNNSVRNGDSATANGVTVFCWDDGTSVLYLLWSASGAISSIAKVAGTRPRAVAVGNNLWIVYRHDGTTLKTIVAYGSGTAGSITVNNASIFDVAPFSSTQWVLAYKSGASAVKTSRMTDSTETDTLTHTAASTVEAVGTFGLSGIGAITAWTTNTSIVQYEAVNTTGWVSYGGPTTCSSSGIPTGAPSPVADAAGGYWIYWTTADTGTTQEHALNKRKVTLAGGTSGSQEVYPHWVLASKPVLDSTTGYILTVLSIDNERTTEHGAGWRPQRHYYVAASERNDPAFHVALHDAPLIGGLETLATAQVPSLRLRSDNKYVYPALRIVRTGTSFATDTIGLDAFTFKTFANYPRRDVVLAQRAAYLGGGAVTEVTSVPYESGFLRYPVIVKATVAAGGSMEAGTRSYVAVYEFIDARGRRHRSAPSTPITRTTNLNDKITLTITSYGLGKGLLNSLNAPIGPVTIHLYRTAAGGTTYYRITGNHAGAGGILAWYPASPGPIVTYQDTVADTTITDNEILYTDGNVLPNVLPPASDYLAVGGSRLWLGGLMDRTRVLASKLLVPSEPAQFSDSDVFYLDLPEEITGIAWMDGALIAFSRTSIHYVTGQGPNDQGFGSFDPPRKLPSDVGCISHHSILEIQDGLLFQSLRGFYLLPRGLGPPQFIGADAQNTLRDYPTVLDSVLVPEQGNGGLGETTARFIVSDGTNSRVLVYDTLNRKWVSVDNLGVKVLLLGIWGDRAVYVADLNQTNPIRQESYSTYGDAAATAAFVSTKLRTTDIRPFGYLGWGSIQSIQVMFVKRGDSNLHMELTVDGVTVNTMTSKAITTAAGYTTGTRYYVEFSPAQHRGNSFDVAVWDTAVGGAVSQGLEFLGLVIETEAEQAAKRLGSAARA